MDYSLKVLIEQLQGLIIVEIETKQMRANAFGSELKILLHDTLKIIREHKEYLKEEISYLENKEESINSFENNVKDALNEKLLKRKETDRNLANEEIKVIEENIKCIYDLLGNNNIEEKIKVNLKNIMNKYSYMDSELENYIQRIDIGEV